MAEQLTAMVERRSRHEPLQYILGYTEFFGMHLDVSPDVLIPRPETEQVVEEALRALGDVDTPRILDIGTGSGCIALVIKRERPSAEVWAADISDQAIDLASRNAIRHGLKIQFLRADVFASDFSKRSPKGLDLLISNPPYIPEEEASALPVEVRNFEPHLALVAPSDPLIFYKRIATIGKDLLKNGRHLILETHSEHGREAEGLLHHLGYEDVVLQRDYADRPRILMARHREAD
jgi:release factor glutamine methyltransferase